MSLLPLAMYRIIALCASVLVLVYALGGLGQTAKTHPYEFTIASLNELGPPR